MWSFPWVPPCKLDKGCLRSARKASGTGFGINTGSSNLSGRTRTIWIKCIVASATELTDPHAQTCISQVVSLCIDVGVTTGVQGEEVIWSE